MPKVYYTVLQPASGGFGEWDWIEGALIDDIETLDDYEEMLSDPYGADLAGRWERTDALSGRIHNELGQIYRIDSGSRDPYGDPIYSYEMVWVEE